MAYLQSIDNETYTTSVLDDNNTNSLSLCYGVSMNYIPTVPEYRKAAGGYGTAFVAVGSVTTTLLYLLLIQQAWFTFSNTHKVYRRHIYWLISIYPFVTLMTTVAFVVPRAHQLCTAIKVVYMCIGVGHFADLTLLMYGSENKMVYELKDSSMQLNVLPICCFFPCLPTPPTSRLRLSLLKWMIWQMKWTQTLYYILLYVIRYSLQFPNGVVSPRFSFLWLTILNIASFVSGVYALNILGALCNEKLLRFRYRMKSLAVKLLILTIKFQGFIFDMCAIGGVFPCLAPMITPVVYQDTLENSMFLVEMVIFGLLSYLMYRLPEFKDYEEPVIPEIQSKETKNIAGPSVIQVEKHTTSADSGSSGAESAYGSTDSADGQGAGSLGWRSGYTRWDGQEKVI